MINYRSHIPGELHVKFDKISLSNFVRHNERIETIFANRRIQIVIILVFRVFIVEWISATTMPDLSLFFRLKNIDILSLIFRGVLELEFKFFSTVRYTVKCNFSHTIIATVTLSDNDFWPYSVFRWNSKVERFFVAIFVDVSKRSNEKPLFKEALRTKNLYSTRKLEKC